MNQVIYKITSPINRIYIGQTKNFRSRFLKHRHISKMNKATHEELQNSYFRYGFNNHLFEIIHKFNFEVSQDVIDEYEDLYIRKYKDLGFSMLNSKRGGIHGITTPKLRDKLSSRFTPERKKRYSEERSGELNARYGIKHTDETRKKMSIMCKGKNLGASNPRALAVIQYDLNGNFIKEWPSAVDAVRILNISSSQGIYCSCVGKAKTSGGFVWKYKIPKSKIA